MTSDRSSQTPEEEPENGVLDDGGGIDTTDLGFLTTSTAHINVILPSGDEDLDDDDVVDEADDISLLFNSLLTGEPVSSSAEAEDDGAEDSLEVVEAELENTEIPAQTAAAADQGLQHEELKTLVPAQAAAADDGDNDPDVDADADGADDADDLEDGRAADDASGAHPADADADTETNAEASAVEAGTVEEAPAPVSAVEASALVSELSAAPDEPAVVAEAPKGKTSAWKKAKAKAKAKAERAAAEAEAKRIAQAEAAEAERVAAAERSAEAERAAQAEAERAAAEEAAEAERRAVEAEAERVAAEADAERAAAEAAAEAERVEAERLAAEADAEAEAEAERVAAEAAAEAERVAAVEAEEAERAVAEAEAAEAAEAERLAAEEAVEAERVAAAEAEAERAAAEAEEAAEAERLAAEEAAEAERLAAEAEAERVAAEEALAAEVAAAEMEAERLAAEAEAERAAAEEVAAIEAAAEAERVEAERAAAETVAEAEREAERVAAEADAEAARLTAEAERAAEAAPAAADAADAAAGVPSATEPPTVTAALRLRRSSQTAPVTVAPSAAPHAAANQTSSPEENPTVPEANQPTSKRDVHDLERVATRQEPTSLASKRLDDLGAAGRETPDLLTADRLLDPAKQIKPEPEGGWQHFVYALSGRRINLGDGRRARERKALTAKIAAPMVGGSKFVPVLSRKGGVGKTTITTLLGMALADARDDRVVAVDANPDRGTLSERISRSTQKTVRDLVRVRDDIRGFNDLSAIVARDETRLDVLASDADPRVAEAFSDTDYRHVAEVAGRFYSIVLTDTGTGIVHSVMGATLDLADQIVIVAGLSVDEARLASETLTWLETNGFADIARDAIVVLNQTSAGAPVVRLNEVEAHFRTRVREVVRIPYDPLIASGSAIHFHDLQPATRIAARELAARVVAGLRETAN